MQNIIITIEHLYNDKKSQLKYYTTPMYVYHYIVVVTDRILNPFFLCTVSEDLSEIFKDIKNHKNLSILYMEHKSDYIKDFMKEFIKKNYNIIGIVNNNPTAVINDIRNTMK